MSYPLMLERVRGQVDAELDAPGVVGLALKHADLSRVTGVREEVVSYTR